MVRSKPLLPILAKQRSSSTAGSNNNKMILNSNNNSDHTRRSLWPPRFPFWRSSSNNSKLGTLPAGEEEEEDASYRGSGSMVSRSDRGDDEESSTSSSSSTSSESYGRSYVTGDGEYEDDTYITNDEERTAGTYEDLDDDDDDDGGEEIEDALQDFVGGVLSKANRSFRRFIASSTGIVESTTETKALSAPTTDKQGEDEVDGDDDDDDVVEDTTAIEYDTTSYNEHENSIIHESPSYVTADHSCCSSKVTTTTAEEHLASNVMLVHEVHEVNNSDDSDKAKIGHDDDDATDETKSAIFAKSLYPTGCAPFEPFLALGRHTSKSSNSNTSNQNYFSNVRANRSFASEMEESNFLQMQEKLRETQRQKMIRITQSLEDTATTISPGNQNDSAEQRGSLMRDVLDHLPFFGCVPDRHLEAYVNDDIVDDMDDVDDPYHRQERKVEDDATYGYETGTDAETYEQHSIANDTATYGDDNTNAYETQYTVDDEEGQGDTQDGYGTTGHNNNNNNYSKYSIRKSLRRGLEGLKYGDLNRLYQTTDESSIGSGMDQSHIYLMMTSARRQRNMQQRKQQNQQQQQQSQQRGNNKSAKTGIQPHNAEWQSAARPQIMSPSTAIGQEQPIEKESRNTFLSGRFVNDLMKAMTNTSSKATTTTTTPDVTKQLEQLQATREIQNRWIREIQISLRNADKYAPNPERQQAAQEALERIRENGRFQPQSHHFRLSTSNLSSRGG